MRFCFLFAMVLTCLLGVAPVVVAQSDHDASEVEDLLERAEILMALGVVDGGADRSFDEVLATLETADNRLAAADLSPAERHSLALEIEAVREDFEVLTELYGERFFGVFPLARLTIPTLLADEGFAVTEELYHAPDVAAVEDAVRRLLKQIDKLAHPKVVIRSSPADRLLEYVAAEVLTRDRRSTPYSRRALDHALSEADLAAFDRGEINSTLVDRLMVPLDAVSLVVLTIVRSVDLEDACRISLQADYYQSGDIISGARADGEFNIHSDSIEYVTFARDRRDQFWPIVGVQLLLFIGALAWAAHIPWGISRPLKIPQRLAMGVSLFVFGRVFIIVVVVLLQRVAPEPSSLVASAWWWPALLGLMTVPGAGLTAWIGQSRLTDIVPGARGARAVGSIFALVSLGACSYFVAPVFLLDGSRGFALLVPLFLSTFGLAVLFGFAARTGPPVPHTFMIGPLLISPFVGVSLLMASPTYLWFTVGLTAVLGLAAWLRHRYALAHGTEEPEPTAEEAAQTDQQRLVKLSKRLSKKL